LSKKKLKLAQISIAHFLDSDETNKKLYQQNSPKSLLWATQGIQWSKIAFNKLESRFVRNPLEKEQYSYFQFRGFEKF